MASSNRDLDELVEVKKKNAELEAENLELRTKLEGNSKPEGNVPTLRLADLWGSIERIMQPAELLQLDKKMNSRARLLEPLEPFNTASTFASQGGNVPLSRVASQITKQHAKSRKLCCFGDTIWLQEQGGLDLSTTHIEIECPRYKESAVKRRVGL